MQIELKVLTIDCVNLDHSGKVDYDACDATFYT